MHFYAKAIAVKFTLSGRALLLPSRCYWIARRGRRQVAALVAIGLDASLP